MLLGSLKAVLFVQSGGRIELQYITGKCRRNSLILLIPVFTDRDHLLRRRTVIPAAHGKVGNNLPGILDRKFKEKGIFCQFVVVK